MEEEKQETVDKNEGKDGKLLELKLQQEMEALKAQLAEKESIIKDYESLLKKLQADFDNYRKRVEKEREEYTKYVNERLVKKMLNILDDLERGLRDSTGNGGYEAFREGVEKIRNNTMQILQEEGLKEIPANGTFDPYYHEALVVEEKPDCADNAIMEVYQKGYTLGGKVIRPARVRVARRIEKTEGDDNQEVKE